MSRTTRFQVQQTRLRAQLAARQRAMAVNVPALRAAANSLAAGSVLNAAQSNLVSLAQSAVPAPAPAAGASTSQLASHVRQLADLAAVEQRTQLSAALVGSLKSNGWNVLKVPGGEPDRYTGIEASRGDEHMVAAIGNGEILADQSGAHDCADTVAGIVAGFAAVGVAVEVTDDVLHDGAGGLLYNLPGGPTRAHAIQASLRADYAAAPVMDQTDIEVGPTQIQASAG